MRMRDPGIAWKSFADKHVRLAPPCFRVACWRKARMMRRMQRKLQQYVTLSLLPLREVLRTPVVLLLAGAAVCSTLLVPLALAFQFGDTGQRLVRDGGLALQLGLGIILCAYAACAILRTDQQSGVAAMLLTKPVTRPQYLLSRFGAIALLALLFSAITTPATLLAHRAVETLDPQYGYVTDVRAALAGLLCIPLACAVAAWQNWRKQQSFHATALGALPALLWATCGLMGFISRTGVFSLTYHPHMDPGIILAALPLLVALWVFAALALTLGIRLPPVTTMALCLLTLFGGLLAGARIAHAPTPNTLLAWIPNWNLFWPATQLDQSPAAIIQYLPWPLLYGCLLILGILTVGVQWTHRLEIQQ